MPSYQVPAVCSACERTFPTRLRDSTVDDSPCSRRSLEPCPFCGGTGQIADGVYDVAIRGWAVIRSAPVTRYGLITSASVVRRALENDARNLLDVHRQLANRSPGLGELVAVLENSALPSTRSTLELLLSIITAAMDPEPPAISTSRAANLTDA